MSEPRRRPAHGGKLIGLGGLLMAAIAALSMVFDGEVFDTRGADDRAATGPAVSAIPPAAAADDTREWSGLPPPFDYYVLALSWSPSFCARQPDADQCGRGHRFVLHGLWPQFKRGYPSDCRVDQPRVPGALLRRYDGLTVSRGLLAYQWRKHGSCTGLAAEDYFEASRQAMARVAIPDALQRAGASVSVDPLVIESAFLEANPTFKRENVTVTCKSGDLAEVRVCLTRSLAPRRCGPDVIRDCRSKSIDLPAPR